VKKEKWAGQPKLAVAGGESSTAVATDHDVASGPD